MEQPSVGSNGPSSTMTTTTTTTATTTTTTAATSQMPHVLFREIHKNAYLKKHASERRAGFPRKSERVWVVFCVHDDVDAFLEVYPDQKVALAHKPDWFASLANALHVSPSICGHEDEFEFAVTLTTQVIRLAAPTWESMMEWVDTIRNKLRELKVLSPKENLYSKMPEQKQPLLPTRDPNSPLPLPPDGPSALLPGVEPVRPEARGGRNMAGARSTTETETTLPSSSTTSSSSSSSSHQMSVAAAANHVSVVDAGDLVIASNRTRIGLNRTVSVPEPRNIPTTCSNITVIEVSCPSKRSSSESATAFESSGDVEATSSDDVFVTPPVTPKLLAPGEPSTSSGTHYEHVFLHNSIVMVENAAVSMTDPGERTDTDDTDDDEGNSSHVAENCHNRTENGCQISQQIQSKLEKVTISGLIPRVPAKTKKDDEGPLVNGTPPYSQVVKKGKSRVAVTSSPVASRRRHLNEEDEVAPRHGNNINAAVPSTSSGNVTRPTKVHHHHHQQNNNNHVANNNNVDVEPLTATVQPAVGVIAVEDIPIIGGHQRRRRRSSSSDSAPGAARGLCGADRIRINVAALITPRPEDGSGDGRGLDVRNESSVEQQQSGHVIAKSSSSRLTLREQQVLQLRREMMHPGGVRLQLRRKECIGSIALVDVASGVWIAGWKQREHPMLYNALHIGDQLVSVCDVVVRSAADAHKIIRTSPSLYIEVIVRRVPLGRVFALHRTSEGQPLGIVQEGNTAEIRDVVPNGVAARAGLSSKTPSMDGLSLTTWFLTEVNGRPLNLFFKDNEVRDRLNAVGKDMSILVQPHDFIKQIKKNLKNLRSYKDYIVQ